MVRQRLTCVLFRKKPEDTHFKSGTYSWVRAERAEQLIAGGYGVEYDPKEGTKVSEPARTMQDTKTDIMAYLDAQDIDYSPKMTKKELIELANA